MSKKQPNLDSISSLSIGSDNASKNIQVSLLLDDIYIYNIYKY